jgi:predicted Zn-dependent protease
MRTRLLRTCAASLALAGCVQSHYNLATDRQDYTLTSIEREVNVGRKLAAKVEDELPPVLDTALQDKVDAIGQRLAAVCGRNELLYRFKVIQGEDVNAFSLPGGYIFLFEELVKKTSSDDELAGVLAHEIAHIAARHAVHRSESGMAAQLLQLATMITRQPAATSGVSIALQAAMLSYAREDEIQADRLAVRYMKAAGFDPVGMQTFLKTMQTVHQQQTPYLPRGVVRPNYATTHPGISERIAAVKEELYGVADYIDYLNVPR